MTQTVTVTHPDGTEAESYNYVTSFELQTGPTLVMQHSTGEVSMIVLAPGWQVAATQD